jgi:hypothetical protein
MTQDAIAQFRKQQYDLAEALAEELYSLSDGATTLAMEEAPPPSSRLTAVPGDDDTDRIVHRRDFVHSLIGAIHDYTDWLASRIYLSGDYQPRELPEAPSELCDAYGKRHRQPDNFIWTMSVMLKRCDRVIPILGNTTKRILVPNEEAIRQWASFYDWPDLHHR